MKGCSADVRLEEYKDFKQKNAFYQCNVVIDDEDDFDDKFKAWENQSADYAFRGVREAKYMMYTSAQRKWIGKNHCNSFYGFIRNLIRIVRCSFNLQDCFKTMGIDNDMAILCLLQHYGKPSPLIDFSYDVRTALFFAFDEMSYSPEPQEIDGYVSLYRINLTCDSVITSQQKIETNDALRLERLIEDLKENDPDLYERTDFKQSIDDIKNLSYTQFKNVNDVCFLLGGKKGTMRIAIPILNLFKIYQFTNPRIESQNALFILNTTANVPVEKVIADKYPYTKPKVIECYNINKKLKDYICDTYLTRITRETIFPNDPDSLFIQKELDKLFPLNER